MIRQLDSPSALRSALPKSDHTANSMNPTITAYVVPRTLICHPVISLWILRRSGGHNRWTSHQKPNEAKTAARMIRMSCGMLSRYQPSLLVARRGFDADGQNDTDPQEKKSCVFPLKTSAAYSGQFMARLRAWKER